MSTVPRAIGRAIGMGVAWGVAWAPVAVLIGIGIIDPDNSHDEMWVAIGAYPGFISGVIFQVLSGIGARGRGLAELGLVRAALLGGAAGLPIGMLPFALGEPTSALPLWQLAGGFVGVVVLLSALSGVVSVLVSRGLRRSVEIRESGSSHS